MKFVGYEEVNDKLVEELKTTKINKIIFSDLAIDVVEIIRKISEFCDVLLIDHHLFNEDFNSDKITFIDIQGDCAAYICYRLFSQLDKDKDLEKIDWLIASACVADWQYFNNQEFMKKIYEKYGDSFEIIGDKTDFGGIRKSGLFWDLHKQLSTFTPTVDNVPVARYRAVQACLEDINRFTYELEIAPDGKHIVDGFCIKCQESIDENQPMSEQTLVHSDFERQNVLFAPNGRVNGLLDFDALKRGSLLYEFSHTLFNFVCCDPIADKRDVDIYLEDFVKAGLLPIEDLGRIYSSMSRFCMDDLSGFLEIARKRPLDIYKIISHYERALIFAYNNLKL